VSSTQRRLHLNAFLMSSGHHEAAWRLARSDPFANFDLEHWRNLARIAERGTFDSLFLADGPALRGNARHRPAGSLEPTVLLTALAGATSRIGLIATASTSYNAPYNLARRFASLDHVSGGRAGWNIVTTADLASARNFGRDDRPAHTERYERAAEFVDVSVRLWDSWEDDAEIRDVATGRFVDRDKLHYIDFEGRWFKVKGPSITPRPPQGQPLVAALAHATAAYSLAARSADLVFVTPHDTGEVPAIVNEIREEQDEAGRAGETVHAFGDLVVFLGETATAAADRKAGLDELAGSDFTSDAAVFTGTPAGLADQLIDWRDAGLSGFRLRPGAIPHDVTAIARGLVPELQARGAFRRQYEARTLRGLLGLSRPANRYVA
jgi:FMN-dependent oxidoreductase (nitrilotriacetate monooxygenase family)